MVGSGFWGARLLGVYSLQKVVRSNSLAYFLIIASCISPEGCEPPAKSLGPRQRREANRNRGMYCVGSHDDYRIGGLRLQKVIGSCWYAESHRFWWV